jgi:hypothetical protein
MPNADDVRWFKEQFHGAIEEAVQRTPFDLDMLTALACQETGEIWPILRKQGGLSVQEIVALCVGDTLDSDRGRRAFPQTKDDLLAAGNGQEMFTVARQALEKMAVHIASYRGAASNPDKFVHGFGVWQRDLQFFREDPLYFLDKKYEILEETLAKALQELRAALKRADLGDKLSLTDFEMACVAIAYNTGRFDPSRGLKQGFPSDGRFYGEQIFDFIRLSRTVPVPGGSAVLEPPAPGNAIVPQPTPISAEGPALVVDTLQDPLRLRSEPRISDPAGKNVIAKLPDGQPVRAVTGQPINGFMEIETSLFGAHLRGFVSAQFLRAAAEEIEIPTAPAAPTAAEARIPPVIMPRRPNTVTTRTAPADAHSLNEPGQPTRGGTTPAELVAELARIIDWLAVDDPSHERYQPHDGLTFCNIYAHDFCHLAGAYLPRVWWSQRAILALSQGDQVNPLIANTIFEVRANDLFRWLQDFGSLFGWRQTGTLSKLQLHANQGGLGLIVARRKEEGRSGHIVVVVPETDEREASRTEAGEVIAAVQSQAGATNFRHGLGRANWWLGDEFAESAFWIHA